MTNAELIEAIQAGDKRAQEDLLTQNRGLIYWAVNRFRGLAEEDDLAQDCSIAMLEAARTYHDDKGTFSTWFYFYAYKRVMTTGDVFAIPAAIRSRLYLYRQYLTQYEQKTGSTPTDKEICDALQLTPAELAKIRRADIQICSLSAPVGDDLALIDALQAPGSMADEVEEQADKESIWAIVDTLPEDQAELIRQKYREGRRLVDILQETPNARNIEQKALRTLRSRLTRAGIYSEGLKHTGVSSFRHTGLSATERAALLDLGEL